MQLPEDKIRPWLTLLFFVGLSARGAGVTGKSDFNTPVRVLLDRAVPSVRVKSLLESVYVRSEHANRWIQIAQTAEITSALPAPLKHVTARTLVNRIPFNEPTIFVRGGPAASDKLLYRGEVFRGALKFIPGPQGYMVVNHVSLDDYLSGTLGAEMSPSWQIEALRAQAVASRTYALYRLSHPKHREFDLESTVQDQVYRGVEAEDPRIQEAVTSTRNQILSLNQKPIQAFFHSRCGGATESAEKVWQIRGHSAMKKVRCLFCEKFPYVWKALVNAKEFMSAIKLPFTNHFQIEPGVRTPSGRLASLRIESSGQQTEVPAESIRSFLGYSKIKSTRFEVKMEGSDIAIEGVGNGHGVGMCQWGSRYLAQQGQTYRQILAHYYPGAQLVGP